MAHMKLNVAEISSMLDYDFKNDPSEKENMAANGGNNVPDSRRPALYAIEGITGLCKVTEYLPYQVGRYGNKVKAQYEKDPKVKATFYVRGSTYLGTVP